MTNLLDRMAQQVVIRHTCHCDRAGEQPADGQPEVHQFTVDGEDFPWFISARGPLLTRMADDLYTVNVQLFPVTGPPDYQVLSFAYSNGHFGDGIHGNGQPFVPVIGGRRFPWLLTDDVSRLEFSHKTMVMLEATFYARNVDANIPIDDRRGAWAERAVWCAGGEMIKDGKDACERCGALYEMRDMFEHYREKHADRDAL